jgi:hypothetical protein
MHLARRSAERARLRRIGNRSDREIVREEGHSLAEVHFETERRLIYFLSLSVFRPPLWSGGQSSWLQIQRSMFDSRHYQIFWELVGLERGPLSPVNKTKELLEIKSSGSGLESREYGRRDPSRWPRGTLHPQKLALTSPTSGGLLVGIVRSQTQATEFVTFSSFIPLIRFLVYIFVHRVAQRRLSCSLCRNVKTAEWERWHNTPSRNTST